MGHGGADAPVVYAPFVSWADVNLSEGTRKKKQSQKPYKTTISFAYPTRKTGVMFNKAATEIWIRSITCFELVDFPTPIHYDAKTHAVERELCRMMMTSGKANAKHPREEAGEKTNDQYWDQSSQSLEQGRRLV